MTDDNVTNINEAKPSKPEPKVITVDSNQWKSDLINLISVVFVVGFSVSIIGGFLWVVWWLLINFIGHIVFGVFCAFAGFTVAKESR